MSMLLLVSQENHWKVKERRVLFINLISGVVGGIRGRTEATGLGVFYGIREFLKYPEILKQSGLTEGI